MTKAVKVIPVEEMDTKLYKYLYNLNFRGGSPMQKRFSQARKGKVSGDAFICQDKKEILGWCLLWFKNDFYIDRPLIYFYIKKGHRKKGVGRMLMSAAFEFCKEAYEKDAGVWVHDEVSEKFFSHVKEDIIRYYSEDFYR